MRSIFKKSIAVATLLTISLTAVADETVKLIVTKKDGKSAKLSVTGTSQSQRKTTSDALFVKQSEVSSKMAELYQDRDVIAVERDIIVHQLGVNGPDYPYPILSQQNSDADNTPNDPSFEYQQYFLPRGTASIAGSNILAAWELGEQKIRPKIAVMDGGFLDEGRFDDVKPAYSYSFVNDSESNIGDPAWNSEDELACEDGHGVGVFGVVGAISNNNQDVAGIVDAEMYMLQVMRCGSGSLFSSASALRWAAGDEIAGIPTINEPVDVATFSLGGRSLCPRFMQEAIDFAVSKGVTVFMSAGNDNDTTTGFAPANCNNVTVTTALDNFSGDKASFGNYDEKVDVVTQGTKVGGLSKLDGGIGLWSGTSFAGPISAGIYGLAMAHAPTLSDDLLTQLMSMTHYPLENAPICDDLGCGRGLVNAGAFVEAAIKYEEGGFAQVESALSETVLCDNTPYLMVTGLRARLCKSYYVSIEAEMFPSNEDDIVIYRFYQWPMGETLDPSMASPLYEGIETNYLINDVDLTQQAGLVRCLNGICDNSIILPVSLVNTGTPTACDE